MKRSWTVLLTLLCSTMASPPNTSIAFAADVGPAPAPAAQEKVQENVSKESLEQTYALILEELAASKAQKDKEVRAKGLEQQGRSKAVSKLKTVTAKDLQDLEAKRTTVKQKKDHDLPASPTAAVGSADASAAATSPARKLGAEGLAKAYVLVLEELDSLKVRKEKESQTNLSEQEGKVKEAERLKNLADKDSQELGEKIKEIITKRDQAVQNLQSVIAAAKEKEAKAQALRDAAAKEKEAEKPASSGKRLTRAEEIAAIHKAGGIKQYKAQQKKKKEAELNALETTPKAEAKSNLTATAIKGGEAKALKVGSSVEKLDKLSPQLQKMQENQETLSESLAGAIGW